MVKLYCSVPDIKLTRKGQKSISGWANQKKGGSGLTKLGKKGCGNGLFKSNRKSGIREDISQSFRSEVRSSIKRH